jgi:hypothetical protein
MKKIFVSFISIIFTSSLMAQTGWQVSSGSNLTKIEKMGEQVVLVDIGNSLSISYQAAEANPEMNRSIILSDDKDNEIFRREFKNDAGTAIITSKELAAYFVDRSRLLLYTLSLPKDPAKAALVRVMRIKVCILERGGNNNSNPKSGVKKKSRAKRKANN